MRDSIELAPCQPAAPAAAIYANFGRDIRAEVIHATASNSPPAAPAQKTPAESPAGVEVITLHPHKRSDQPTVEHSSVVYCQVVVPLLAVTVAVPLLRLTEMVQLLLPVPKLPALFQV